MRERLKSLRRELKLTQQEFADRLGVPRNNIAGYETGSRKPSDAMIRLICKEYHVEEQWLRHGTGRMFAEQSRYQLIRDFVASYNLRPDAFKVRLLEALAMLNETDWEDLERLALKLTASTRDNVGATGDYSLYKVADPDTRFSEFGSDTNQSSSAIVSGAGFTASPENINGQNSDDTSPDDAAAVSDSDLVKQHFHRL